MSGYGILGNQTICEYLDCDETCDGTDEDRARCEAKEMSENESIEDRIK